MLLRNQRTARLAVDAGTLAIFLGLMLAPLVDQCVRSDDVRGPIAENRNARPEPSLPRTPAELSAFPAAFEAHHADTFGLRDVLLHWNSVVKMGLWRVTPTPSVVYDRSGWLDYAGERTFDVLRGMFPSSTAQLDAWTSYLALCQGFCTRNGAKYLYVAVPNKETIYTDHVPPQFRPLGPSRYDQLVARLPDSLHPSFLDLRPALRAARTEDRPGNHLYFENGTHWNGRGGWVAYEAVMKRLAAEFPALRPLSDADVEWKVEENSDVDSWGPRLYQPDAFKCAMHLCLIRGPQRWQDVASDTDHGMFHTRNATAGGPKGIVFCDSFGPAFYTLFASTFPEVHFAHSGFDPALVLKEKPDFVMELRVERTFILTLGLSTAARRMMELEAPSASTDQLVWSAATAEPQTLVTTGGARVERSAEGLVFSADTSKDGWILPEFDVAATDRAWLRVEIESASPGTLVVHRREGDDGPWLRRDAVPWNYTTGRQEHVFALPGPPGRRQIRVGFFGTPTRLIVRRLEVRTGGS